MKVFFVRALEFGVGSCPGVCCRGQAMLEGRSGAWIKAADTANAGRLPASVPLGP